VVVLSLVFTFFAAAAITFDAAFAISPFLACYIAIMRNIYFLRISQI
jgi:hypothetical protein